ncbi:MAG: hydroxymethylglutaryl-CoA synthase [Pseudomonadota bacterium]
MATASAAGIEAMGFHGPTHYVDMAELAVARDVEPAKYTKGIGQTQMAVATPCEDTVTMATMAARKALHAFDIDPADIGTLIVGTETGVDHSKPVAVYVHELLGLKSNCRTFETKHACYGAMAGLTSATDWIMAGRARGRKALIVASDIARYGLRTAGEPTQGAGAVAMVVSDTPSLLRFDADVMGDYTRQVMDFWRPLYSKYAFADGHYSIQCYLDAFTGAFEDACSKVDDPQRFALDQLDAAFYHVPFVKMARKAHHRHWEAQLGEIGEAQLPAIAESFEQLVAPWLSLNAVVGNIYTGSLFLALMDYLRSGDAARAGKQVSLFSYGSGCGAAFALGHVGDSAHESAPLLDPQAELDNRVRLAIDEYETLTRATEDADSNEAPDPDPAQWNHSDGLFYVGTREHVRRYEML